jgi:UPF0716 protein FxsA
MLLRLIAAFIIIPLVELFLLLRVAEATSALTAFAIVVITGVIGSYLARREGLMVWTRFQTALQQGRMPSVEIQDGLMVIFAAALLLTPGLLTDALGFTLLTPMGRNLFRGFVLSKFTRGINVHVTTPGFDSDPYAVDPQMHRSEASHTIDVDAIPRKAR